MVVMLTSRLGPRCQFLHTNFQNVFRTELVIAQFGLAKQIRNMSRVLNEGADHQPCEESSWDTWKFRGGGLS